MPLSEDEQRILQDIERNFYEQDPSFARSVSRPAPYRNAARNCKLAAVGIVVGLVVVLGTFIGLPLVAFGGFLIMAVSAGFFAQNIRRLSTAHMLQTAEDQRNQMGDSFDTARANLRDRFRKQDRRGPDAE